MSLAISGKVNSGEEDDESVVFESSFGIDTDEVTR